MPAASQPAAARRPGHDRARVRCLTGRSATDGAEARQARHARGGAVEAETPGGAAEAPEAPARKPVGHVTSVALHHELGPIALALVKRGTDEAAPLAVVVDDLLVAAAQEVVVPASAGAAAGVPRLPRLGAVRR